MLNHFYPHRIRIRLISSQLYRFQRDACEWRPMNKYAATCNSIQSFDKIFILCLENSRLLLPTFSLLDKLKHRPKSQGRRKAQRIYLAIPFQVWEESRALQRRRQQCEWHQVILSARSHLADRIVQGGDSRDLWTASFFFFMSAPYLMIDGSMAAANVPFLNNLCCPLLWTSSL